MIERYALPPMRELWTEQAQYERWLEVECAVTGAYEEVGTAPPGTAQRVREAAVIDAEDIHTIEEEVGHDVIAFLRSITRSMGDEARFVHLGMTSSDVVDTALALALKRSGELLLAKLAELHDVLAVQAVRYRNTVTVGRTHGVHAEPTSFGLKVLSWLAETERNQERLARATQEVACGKSSGAVGNYANIPPRVEEIALARLGLARSKCSTQIVPRDQHAAFVATLALAGAQIERMATEVRLLQRTEVREVQEPFGAHQRGSSAMPHKMNSRSCERIGGFLTILRGHLTMVGSLAGDQWNEGDVFCSVVRRVALPDAFFAVDGQIETFLTVLDEFGAYPAVIQRELDRYLPFLATTKVLIAAVRAGVGRETAHEVIKEHAVAVALAMREKGAEPDLLDRLAADDRLPLDRAALESALADKQAFTGAAADQVDQVIAAVDELVSAYPDAAKYTPGAIL